jgi:ABC-type Mn2+/Zn2+ transport system ATPase subunit
LPACAEKAGEKAGMSLIDVDHLSVSYGATRVLRDVSLHVEPGEIVTIVGPNGSGKTTLLRAIIGAVAPTTGRIARAPGLGSATCRSGCTSTRRCR